MQGRRGGGNDQQLVRRYHHGSQSSKGRQRQPEQGGAGVERGARRLGLGRACYRRQRVRPGRQRVHGQGGRQGARRQRFHLLQQPQVLRRLGPAHGRQQDR